jgi:hypothetical protein
MTDIDEKQKEGQEALLGSLNPEPPKAEDVTPGTQDATPKNAVEVITPTVTTPEGVITNPPGGAATGAGAAEGVATVGTVPSTDGIDGTFSTVSGTEGTSSQGASAGTAGTQTEGAGTSILENGPDYGLSWADFRKANPTVSYWTYLPESAKYRKEHGMDPYSEFEVWRDAQQQFDTEQKKADKVYRRTQMVNTVGDFVANLVNYVRTRNGHPGYQIDLSGERTRLDNLRTQAMQERRQRMQDMLGAWRQSRAEERQAETDKATRDYRERQVQMQEQQQAYQRAQNDRNWDFNQRKYEDSRKDRAEDVAYRAEQGAATIQHQRNQDAAAWARANASGGGGSGNSVQESFTVKNGATYVRNKPLSAQEARNIVLAYGTEGQKARMRKSTANPYPDIVALASEVLTNGQVKESVIRGMHFQKSADYKPDELGWGAGSSAGNNETDW